MPLSDIVDQLEPDLEDVTLVLSRRAQQRVERAREQLDSASRQVAQAEQDEKGKMAKSGRVAKARKLADTSAEKLAAAETAAAAHRHTFWLRQLGNARWNELEFLVPPTDDQKVRIGRGLQHNPELFPIVALAFSLVDVTVNGDDVPTVQGPAVSQDALDRLDKALKAAGGDPDKAVKAADDTMPPELVDLNAKLPHGGWERLTAVLYSLNIEVTQVPLS